MHSAPYGPGCSATHADASAVSTGGTSIGNGTLDDMEGPGDGLALVVDAPIIKRAYCAAPPPKNATSAYKGPNFKRFRNSLARAGRQPPIIVAMVNHSGVLSLKMATQGGAQSCLIATVRQEAMKRGR